jgi:hypothetical protein
VIIGRQSRTKNSWRLDEALPCNRGSLFFASS